MKKWIVEEFGSIEEKYNAASKARKDVSAIAQNNGYYPLYLDPIQDKERNETGILKKIYFHFKLLSVWKKKLTSVEDGDVILIQLPIIRHSIFLKHVFNKTGKNVKIIGVVHDLECLRLAINNDNSWMKRFRYGMEEVSFLKCFDKIIVHNEKMKDFIIKKYKIDRQKLVSLYIFDYLIENYQCSHLMDTNSVIIAGNLLEKKSGYVYRLPLDVKFELYGVNYDNTRKNANICYHGSFPADVLPFKLIGGFGLVWDGPSEETCTGIYGEYLKFNNPHKASLYLACGIPIIIWSKAALADFVMEHKCGIVVNSLYMIGNYINSLSIDEYNILKNNAEAISEQLRRGDYLRNALINSLD